MAPIRADSSSGFSTVEELAGDGRCDHEESCMTLSQEGEKFYKDVCCTTNGRSNCPSLNAYSEQSKYSLEGLK